MAAKRGSAPGRISLGEARRPTRIDEWTDAKRQLFLDALSACATVRTSCMAAEMTVESAYKLRRRDPEFASQWADALATGYHSIEASLLQRAAGALDAADPERMDTELAKWLLAHRDRAGGCKRGDPRRLKSVSPKELNEAILAKLDVLERRERARAAAAGQKPGAVRRGKDGGA